MIATPFGGQNPAYLKLILGILRTREMRSSFLKNCIDKAFMLVVNL